MGSGTDNQSELDDSNGPLDEEEGLTSIPMSGDVHVVDMPKFLIKKRRLSTLLGMDTEQPASSDSEPTEKKVRNAKYIGELITKAMTDAEIEKVLTHEINSMISEHSALKDFDVIFLYDHQQISRNHSSAIYQSLSEKKVNKNILLILRSAGGEVEPAYLISKMCNRFKGDNKFFICIPAEAKSAATLLSLGADELHMGGMSELGPIDPQINDFPALAFSGTLEKITQLADKYPNAADMLAKYLIGSELDVRALGHYDRITESATQYATLLLQAKATSTTGSVKDCESLASHFTNHYKDHNFVIDIDEAQKLLGSDMVKADTDVYSACHEIHKFLETVEQIMIFRLMSKRVVALGRNFHIYTIQDTHS
ncbi:SDH family Clp fold serine proteinase [Pseudomonas sp. WC2]|uniref:SDH family Clp fold serine proteinase n=1 Tax=Pseudomonas sp. WC2 TaxID=3424773 RepID=UPI003D3348D6